MASESFIDEDTKFKLTYNICSALCDLYCLQPPLAHGHLTPKNIFIQDKESLKILIGDLGDNSIRKHARIFSGYNYKSVFSCPEILEDALDHSDPNEMFDVYSFGIIVWEIYSGLVPFNDDYETAFEYVVKNEGRPKIVETIPDTIKEVIRECWKHPNRTI